MNVVMTGKGELVEVQATAEEVPFSRASLDDLLGLAAKGIERAPRGPAGRGRGRLAPACVRWDRLAPGDRHPQRAQAARARRHAVEPLADPAAVLGRAAGGDRQDVRGQRGRARRTPRPRQRASPRSRTTRASRSTRSTARPACAPRGSPARTRPTSRTWRSCSTRCATRRTATRRYVCSIAYVEPDGTKQVFHGRCEGRLLAGAAGRRRLRLRPGVRPRGPRTATSARWPSSRRQEKDEISHRGRAMRELVGVAAAGAVTRRPARRAGEGGGRGRVLEHPADRAGRGQGDRPSSARRGCRSSRTRS